MTNFVHCTIRGSDGSDRYINLVGLETDEIYELISNSPSDSQFKLIPETADKIMSGVIRPTADDFLNSLASMPLTSWLTQDKALTLLKNSST